MPGPNGIEIRCPIYGFIPLNNWEKDIIDQWPFQRLRRIRQLAWTDLVYPGATHTRFEHSLGVMHMASQMFDAITARCDRQLHQDFQYNEAGLKRDRQIVRFAALLHDLGHGPFSHAVEHLAPQKDDSSRKKWTHEEYSAEIIRQHFSDVIENHPMNRNYGITTDDVTGFIVGAAPTGPAALWQDLISGQLDGDRMDYLLRDSHHAGVEYGKYDWQRLVGTITLVNDPETQSPRFGILESGRHAAEALLIARYMMFNQLYFHKTRVILDYHLHNAMADMLEGGAFPSPIGENLNRYLKWDDWQVYSKLLNGEGGEHGERLLARNFYRLIYESPEFPNEKAMTDLQVAEDKLSDLSVVRKEAGKSWYKTGSLDLLIHNDVGHGVTRPLSQISTIMGNMATSRRVRLYVPPENREDAMQRLEKDGRAQ